MAGSIPDQLQQQAEFVISIADQLGVAREGLTLAEARTRVCWHLRATMGGIARTLSMTAAARSASASKAAYTRWTRVSPEERREQMAALGSLRRTGVVAVGARHETIP